jgi:hypothetical protein
MVACISPTLNAPPPPSAAGPGIAMRDRDRALPSAGRAASAAPLPR